MVIKINKLSANRKGIKQVAFNGKKLQGVITHHYRYFLHLFEKYFIDLADIFSYRLLPNQFHFFIRIKNEKTLQEKMEILHYKHAHTETENSKFILQQFSNFFNAYTKAFNNQQVRKGKLFIEPFNRKLVTTPEYYTKLIHYIHANPVHHGFCTKVDEWPYSSFLPILKIHKGLQYEEILRWFGSAAAYEEFHRQPIDRKFKK